MLDGGFQLLITDVNGVPGWNPVTKRPVNLPMHTNFVYSWLRIKSCGPDIVLPYRVCILSYLLLSAECLFLLTY